MTLLEVVLALTLATVVVTGSVSLYLYAMDFRADVGGHSRAAAEERLILDTIAGDLRGASASRFLRMGLRGGGSRISFIRTVVPSAATWLDEAVDEESPPPESDLRIIGYRLRPALDEYGEPLLDEEGNPVIVGLERTRQKVLTAPNVEEGETLGDVQQVEAVVLSTRFCFLHLRFFTGDGWVGRWGGGDLPRAVRIILGRRPLRADEEVEDYLLKEPTVQRVVYLPAAEGASAAAARPGRRPPRGAEDGGLGEPGPGRGEGLR